MNLKLCSYLKSKNPILFLTVYLILSFLVILITILIFYITKFLNPNYVDNHQNIIFDKPSDTIWVKFISVVFIAPIVETFIFQYIIIKSLLGKVDSLWIVLISSSFFGLSHFYDLFYIVNTFFIGLVFATAFINWKGTKLSPFFIVFIVHSLHNLLIFISLEGNVFNF